MGTETTAQNLPWVEKYRPSKLDELISHQDIIKTIDKFISEDRLPHLLFYGPPGTGKTTTILACARKMYTPHQFNSMVLELNASDERGIEVVRERILTFATTGVLAATSGAAGGRQRSTKLVVLDEADAMTKDAQNALRRVIEAYTSNVRFCLICNYLSKIIPAIQSRCTRFRFAPLDKALIMPRLGHVVECEKVNATEGGLNAIVALCGGDMRRVLNVLQCTHMASGVVDEESVYACVGHPRKADIHAIVQSLLNDTFEQCFAKLQALQKEKGIALQDIITEAHHFVLKLDVSSHIHMHVIVRLADMEHRLAAGANEKPQSAALVAAFRFARLQLEKEAHAKLAPAR